MNNNIIYNRQTMDPPIDKRRKSFITSFPFAFSTKSVIDFNYNVDNDLETLNSVQMRSAPTEYLRPVISYDGSSSSLHCITVPKYNLRTPQHYFAIGKSCLSFPPADNPSESTMASTVSKKIDFSIDALLSNTSLPSTLPTRGKGNNSDKPSVSLHIAERNFFIIYLNQFFHINL